MSDIPHLIKMLQSNDPNERYDACEQLRILPSLTQEAIEALHFATVDQNADVADAARRAIAPHTPSLEIAESPNQNTSSTSTKTYLTCSHFFISIFFVSLLTMMTIYWIFHIRFGDHDGGPTLGALFYGIPTGVFLGLILPFILELFNQNKQPKYPPDESQNHPRPLPQYHELSEKIRARFNGELPTYEITTVLLIPNNKEQIILMNFIEAFRNVFRCDPDGSVIWQAELPSDSGDVYTNIEWKENQLMAYSRSCISVILDVDSGKIISPKTAT